MTWLQQRLDELNYTHEDLVNALKEKGIKRVRGTISGWAKGKIAVTPLLDPADTEKLASALQWTVSDMLIAAGYPITEADRQIPDELYTIIPLIRELPPRKRELIIETLVYGSNLVNKLRE